MLTIFSCAFCLYVWKCLLRFSAQFFYSVCFFDIELPETFVYFWDIQNILSGFFFGNIQNTLLVASFANIFLPFSELSSYFVYGFLCVQKLLSLISPFVYFCLFVCFHYSWWWIQKDMAAIYIKECFACFCMCVCKSFIVSGFTFRSLIHFEFI